MKKKNKKIPFSEIKESLKQPRKDNSLKLSDQSNPSWQISNIDIESEWGWQQMEEGEFMLTILPKMQNLESMTWNEILQKKENNHFIEISDIISKAQKRLQELRLEDANSLLSIRFSNLQRIWGIKKSNVLQVLWWDPKHEICPAPKKHT